MTQYLGLITVALFSYVLGAIPSGYIIAKRVKGIDIRKYGSNNPGAANVYRTVGKWSGWGTMFFDALKGFIAVHIALYFYGEYSLFIVLCSTLSILGHMWTIFLNFKGGKGVATSFGVFIALLPMPAFIVFVIFLTAVAITKHISIGSVLSAIAMPFVSFFLANYPVEYCILATLFSVLVVYKHIPNIKRIVKKEELKFECGRNKKYDEKNK